MQYTTNLNKQVSTMERHDKWRFGGLFLMIALAIQGISLGDLFNGNSISLAGTKHLDSLDRALAIGNQDGYLSAIVWGSLYFGSFIVIFRNGQRSFLRALLRRWPITILTLLIPLSIMWSSNEIRVLMNSAHALGVLMIAFAAAMHYRDKPHILVRHLSIVLGVSVVFHLSMVLILQSNAMDYNGRWYGLTTHPNTLGKLAALTIWSNTVAILIGSDWRRNVSWVMILCAVVALLGSNSMTSSIVSVIVVFISVVVLRGIVITIPRFMYMLLCGLALLILSYISLNFVQSQLFQIIGRGTDFTGRLFIWQKAIELIQARPLLGWGFDLNARAIETVSLLYMQFHNGYLDIAVRGGLIALILFALTLFQLLRDIIYTKSVSQILYFSFLALFLTHNSMEASIVMQRNALWMIYLFLIFCSIPRRDSYMYT